MMKRISRRGRQALITLYNYVSVSAGVATYQRTVLKPVYLDTGYAQRLSQRGVSVTDRAQLILDLWDTEATAGRSYLPCRDWAALDDKSGYFTFSAANDFFVAGEVSDELPPSTKADMLRGYPCFSINSVSAPAADILQILGK